jgi:N-methylhydantoinase A
VHEPGQYLECLVWKARATAELSKPPLAGRETRGLVLQPTSAPAYFAALGLTDVPRYEGPTIPSGTVIEGPAIVTEPTTTVVVHPGSTVTVTSFGNYLLAVAGPDETRPLRAPLEAAAR